MAATACSAPKKKKVRCASLESRRQARSSAFGCRGANSRLMACDLAHEENAMGTGNGADDRDQAEHEQYPMKGDHTPQRSRLIALSALVYAPANHERLQDEKHHGKQEPHQHHRAHSPV